MTIQYLLDEHIAPLYRTQLVRQAPDLVVRMIGDPDAPPKGTLDPEILIWCETHNFILVTNNRKSMPKQIHQARQFLAKPENTVHSNVTAEPSTLAVSRNALKNIPKAPFQSLGIE